MGSIPAVPLLATLGVLLPAPVCAADAAPHPRWPRRCCARNCRDHCQRQGWPPAHLAARACQPDHRDPAGRRKAGRERSRPGGRADDWPDQHCLCPTAIGQSPAAIDQRRIRRRDAPAARTDGPTLRLAAAKDSTIDNVYQPVRTLISTWHEHNQLLTGDLQNRGGQLIFASFEKADQALGNRLPDMLYNFTKPKAP